MQLRRPDADISVRVRYSSREGALFCSRIIPSAWVVAFMSAFPAGEARLLLVFSFGFVVSPNVEPVLFPAATRGGLQTNEAVFSVSPSVLYSRIVLRSRNTRNTLSEVAPPPPPPHLLFHLHKQHHGVHKQHDGFHVCQDEEKEDDNDGDGDGDENTNQAAAADGNNGGGNAAGAGGGDGGLGADEKEKTEKEMEEEFAAWQARAAKRVCIVLLTGRWILCLPGHCLLCGGRGVDMKLVDGCSARIWREVSVSLAFLGCRQAVDTE